jgi:ABC-type sugar transport system substrate-binding protein
MRCRHSVSTAILLVALAATACASPADRTEMNRQSLFGDAVDGSLLADQIMSGQASATFARTHAQELQDDADQVELNVTDERLPHSAELEQVANALSSALNDMAVHPGDAAVARDAKAALQELAAKTAKSS